MRKIKVFRKGVLVGDATTAEKPVQTAASESQENFRAAVQKHLESRDQKVQQSRDIIRTWRVS